MKNSNTEILKKILCEVPSRIISKVEGQQFETASYFDFEIIPLDSDIEDSILFSSLTDAVESVTELTMNKNQSEIHENIKQLLLRNGINENQSFKVKVIH
ncbi:hypothetical protein ABF176_002334 [Flavobacterium psychrophilum]|uniref:hypothetical protein n=1 Tax=Flavobacterium psychrophilum TaxID=96345 RepID=UPI001069910B|nr:hypothetical protein [Flavobacterium psychrophilum]MCB6089706.1 hypothetical protein [Flavobacterium psychrophilum]MCB6232256.1 hypothetical protein [Flavobacterium psychrophilum]MEB3380704.1 hypothetical protein [Flavobacterium psychrophilum]